MLVEGKTGTALLHGSSHGHEEGLLCCLLCFLEQYGGYLPPHTCTVTYSHLVGLLRRTTPTADSQVLLVVCIAWSGLAPCS